MVLWLAKKTYIASVAQSVEQLAFNQLVVGSSPTRSTNLLLSGQKPSLA